MATSRDLTFIDALAAKIAAEWNPAAPDEVSREYLAAVTEKDLHQLLGRRVYLFPASYQSEDANRSQNLYGYGVGVVVAERYEDADKASSAAVKEWLDERLDFVEAQLIDGLDFGQGDTMFAVGNRRVWTESIECPLRYDVETLAEKKMFRCDVNFVFREIQ